MVKRKKCSKCGETKALNGFFRDKSHKDGLASACRSCKGKQNRDWRKENKEKQRLRNLRPQRVYSGYKQNAKKRNIEFLLTKEEFMTFWQQPCTYCGKEIVTAGIDRIDNNFGYILENCTPCCSVCNWMKMQMGVNEWFDHMFTILKKNNIIRGE